MGEECQLYDVPQAFSHLRRAQAASSPHPSMLACSYGYRTSWKKLSRGPLLFYCHLVLMTLSCRKPPNAGTACSWFPFFFLISCCPSVPFVDSKWPPCPYHCLLSCVLVSPVSYFNSPRTISLSSVDLITSTCKQLPASFCITPKQTQI